jgi:hypothetical protein
VPGGEVVQRQGDEPELVGRTAARVGMVFAFQRRTGRRRQRLRLEGSRSRRGKRQKRDGGSELQQIAAADRVLILGLSHG